LASLMCRGQVQPRLSFPPLKINHPLTRPSPVLLGPAEGGIFLQFFLEPLLVDPRDPPTLAVRLGFRSPGLKKSHQSGHGIRRAKSGLRPGSNSGPVVPGGPSALVAALLAVHAAVRVRAVLHRRRRCRGATARPYPALCGRSIEAELLPHCFPTKTKNTWSESLRYKIRIYFWR